MNEKEINALGVAGYIPERYAWMLILDIATQLADMYAEGRAHGAICPGNIQWDGKRFILVGDGTDGDHRFEAPNPSVCSEDDVWSLGASVFFLCLECCPFRNGGRTQERESPIPFMRREYKELSETVAACLSFERERRPTLSELVSIAQKQAGKVKGVGERPKKAPAMVTARQDDFWPEEMR